MDHKKLNRELTVGILVGVALGLVFAFKLIPDEFLGIPWVEIARLSGDIFMLALKAVAVPLVFISVLCGVLSLGNILSFERIGTYTIFYYVGTTFIAATIGILLVNIIQPGAGLEIETQGEFTKLDAVKDMTVLGMLEDQIRNFIINPFGALATGASKMVAIILGSISLGLGLLAIGEEKNHQAVNFFNTINDAVLVVTNFVLKFAPYGVAGILIAVFADRRDSLGQLIEGLSLFTLTSLLGLTIHGLIVIPLIVRFIGRYDLKTFFRGIREPLKVAFGTDSSLATMPVTLEAVQDNLKVEKKTSEFVIPIGATINMDGTALYEAVSALFIAQALGFELTLFQQVVVVLTSMVASIGAAGIPSAGLVTLVIVINAVGIPYEAAVPIIGMIYAIDRFIDMCRTMVNVEGDCGGAVVIDRLLMRKESKKT